MREQTTQQVETANGLLRGVLIALATTVAMAALTLGTCVAVKASAAEPDTRCDTVYSVLGHPELLDQADVRTCRRAGWVINRWVVVDPYGYAVTDLPRCEREETSSYSCVWDALRRANSHGHGFIALPGRTIYVDSINGRYVTAKGLRQDSWFITPAKR